ncbi:MAG: FHA domain-containing protein, partial [Anaerolinea sp.]|nr:FHA domain-containing protein [Anaerolinea sp.]
FPQLEDRERLQILALVPGTNANEPVLANSDPLVITVERPPVVSTSVGATTVSPTNGLNTLLVNLPILGVVFFGATNILLFRAVRKARIRRLIERPDNHELSPELMSITVYRGGVPQHFTLTKKTVTVGRTSANDINLGEDPNISRKHGVIMWRRRQWYYSNRKGSLSTRINGRRYHGYIFYRLEPMTELQVGSATMVFHSNAQQNISDFIKTDL